MIYHYPKNPTVKITHSRFEAELASLSTAYQYRFQDDKIMLADAYYSDDEVIFIWKVKVWFKWQDSSLGKPIDMDFSDDFQEKTFTFYVECAQKDIYEKVTIALVCVEGQMNTRVSEGWSTHYAPYYELLHQKDVLPHIEVQDVKPER